MEDISRTLAKEVVKVLEPSLKELAKTSGRALGYGEVAVVGSGLALGFVLGCIKDIRDLKKRVEVLEKNNGKD